MRACSLSLDRQRRSMLGLKSTLKRRRGALSTCFSHPFFYISRLSPITKKEIAVDPLRREKKNSEHPVLSTPRALGCSILYAPVAESGSQRDARSEPEAKRLSVSFFLSKQKEGQAVFSLALSFLPSDRAPPLPPRLGLFPRHSDLSRRPLSRRS